jgi:hypothetical protein
VSPRDREPFLAALDGVLLPIGFKRRKPDFEWTRRVEGRDLEWIHLNFGLGGINPSFGVKYEDLSMVLPLESGAVYSVCEMVSSFSGKSYSAETVPRDLAADVLALALPGLDRLRDRALVVDRLRRESPREWPTLGASARMRLLPLMLAHSGRINDALEWLREHEAAAERVDQHVPNFASYAAYFRARYTA